MTDHALPADMLAPDDIRWLVDHDEARQGTCAVCRHDGVHAAVLTVPAMSAPDTVLALYRCTNCGSLFFDPPHVTQFSDLDDNRDEFWRFYVEVGGGVWETIWPILAAEREGSLLDVGCGFGFALDFWQRSNRGEAVGLELAAYGRKGAEMLGVTIYDEMLQDCAALASRKFDVVYASEVIEHVPDPEAFASLLAQWVAPDGVLVMTTPAAAFIKPENQSNSLLAALAPGFHGFLLSGQALGDAVRRAGFRYVDVQVVNEREFVWASRQPLRIELASQSARASYFDYLARRVADGPDTSTSVWQGLAYRYGKDLVNVGRLDEAKAVLTHLVTAVTARFGVDVIDPERALARLQASQSLADYGRVAPFFLPSLFFFLGALALHRDRDPALALRYYAGAAASTLESARFGSLFFLDALSLLWPARVRQAELLLASGQIVAGVELFERLANEGDACERRNGFALAPRDLLDQSLPRVTERLHAAGYRQQASRLYDGYRRYVERRYGQSMLTIAGIEAALTAAEDGKPLDPLFAPLFGAQQAVDTPAADTPAVGNETSSGDALTTLAEVARVADLYATDGQRASRAKEMAARARQLIGVAARPARSAILWSSDFTFNQRSRP